MNPGMLSSVSVSALACYIFDTDQPILIIFVDSKAVVLSTAYTYYFSLGHFLYHQFINNINVISCVGTTSSAATRTTMVDPHSNTNFCNNNGRQGLRSSFCWETLWL